MVLRSISLIASAGILALLLGCVGPGDRISPVVPASSGGPVQLTTPASAEASPCSHSLWGLWQCWFDPETGEPEIGKLRKAEFHLNIVGYLQPPMPPGLGISINSFDPTAGTIDLDVTITHPFPFTNLRGFDVRGIVMGEGDTIAAKDDPDVVYAAPTGLRLLNTDGYTRWWNPTEFTTPGIYGFTPGASGFPDFVSPITLNPYKYFADALLSTDPVVPNVELSNRGTFSTDVILPSLTRNYQLQFPIIGGSPSWKFQYAIDASWAKPTGGSPIPKPIEDFPIEANCPEAYHILVDTTGTTAFFHPIGVGGDLVLAIEVFDWAAAENPMGTDGEISSIVIESDTLFDSPVNVSVTSATGSAPTSGIYYVTVEDVHPTGLDNQEVLVAIYSEQPHTYAPPISGPVYPSGAELAAYALVEIPISDEIPPVDTITVWDPNGGEVLQGGETYEIIWTWTGDMTNVEILLSTDSGANYDQPIVPSAPCTGSFIWDPVPMIDTTTARIKISDFEYPQINDESDGDFEITTVNYGSWDPVPGLVLVPLTDPAPNQSGVPTDLMVFSMGDDDSRGEIHDQDDDYTFKRYNDTYAATTGPEWQYVDEMYPLHKFDVLLDGSWVFVTNSNRDSVPMLAINDPNYACFTANDNVTGEKSGGGSGLIYIYGDTGVPDPDLLPWRHVVDFSSGVPDGVDETTAYQLVTYSEHLDNPQPHDGNLILCAWAAPYDFFGWNWHYVDACIAGGGQGYVDDSNPDIMALAADDNTNLGTVDNPVVGIWVLDSVGIVQCIAMVFTTGVPDYKDNPLDIEEYGIAIPVDIEIAPAKSFDYSVTQGEFNWLVALLDNGDGSWSVGVWEYDYLAGPPPQFTEIDITDPIPGIPLAVDVDCHDFEIHVLSDISGTVVATVFEYTPG